MATTKLMTADDLLLLPDDGHRYELIRGELRRMPPAGMDSSAIAGKILRHVGNHTDEHNLGVVTGADGGFFIERDSDTILVPDVAFTRANRLPGGRATRGFSPVPPDLAVEVVSPSDRPHEVQEKIDLYLAAGVPLIWQVEPRHRAVLVHRPSQEPQTVTEDGELDGGDVLPGFRLHVAQIF